MTERTPAPPTLRWVGGLDGHLELLEQTKLPLEVTMLPLHDVEGVRDAIWRLAVRGAPAIGVAAAYGLVLGARELKPRDLADLRHRIAEPRARLAGARPTAVNLFWALDRMTAHLEGLETTGADEALEALLSEARRIHEEDAAICRRLGEIGADLVAPGDGLLTHCNAGALATSAHGTALAVFFEAHRRGFGIRAYADETRPLLQGARLTAWELQNAGIDVTVLCDGAAGSLFQSGRVQKVFVGSDRIARNGDVCNKIGTYTVATLAKAHGVPFYAVAPISTIDPRTPDGASIPIEERPAEEVTEGFGRRTAPPGVGVWSPAFDVTPAELVTGIVTERGLVSPVTPEAMERLLAGDGAASA